MASFESEDALREVVERERASQGVNFLVRVLYVAWATAFLGVVLGFFQTPLPIVPAIVIVGALWLGIAGALLKSGSEWLRDWLKKGWVLAPVVIACLWLGQIGGDTLAEVAISFAGMTVTDEPVYWQPELHQPLN